jgi:putative adhesin
MGMTRFFGAFVLCVACSLPAGAQQGRGESGFDWSKRLPSGATITVRNSDGLIHVRESTSDRVEVRATKSTGSRTALNEIAFDVNETRDGATICTVYGSQRSCGDRARSVRGSSLRVEYTVLVPRDVRVNVSTGRGEITVERVGSAVSASTGSGRVFVSTERGPVSVSSGSGDIDVRILSSPADADVSVVTGNGLIRVSVPTEFGGDVDAQSENGTFRSDFEITILGRIDAHHIRGTIGRGSSRIRLQTGNGRIELRKS